MGRGFARGWCRCDTSFASPLPEEMKIVQESEDWICSALLNQQCRDLSFQACGRRRASATELMAGHSGRSSWRHDPSSVAVYAASVACPLLILCVLAWTNSTWGPFQNEFSVNSCNANHLGTSNGAAPQPSPLLVYLLPLHGQLNFHLLLVGGSPGNRAVL